MFVFRFFLFVCLFCHFSIVSCQLMCAFFKRSMSNSSHITNGRKHIKLTNSVKVSVYWMCHFGVCMNLYIFQNWHRFNRHKIKSKSCSVFIWSIEMVGVEESAFEIYHLVWKKRKENFFWTNTKLYKMFYLQPKLNETQYEKSIEIRFKMQMPFMLHNRDRYISSNEITAALWKTFHLCNTMRMGKRTKKGHEVLLDLLFSCQSRAIFYNF